MFLSDVGFADETTATFVLHHPEHGHAVILPIISCLIDGTLVYTKEAHPFASFISLVSPTSEVYSFPTALLSFSGTLFFLMLTYMCVHDPFTE